MVSLFCKYCQKIFEVLPYRSKTAICCSRKCLWHITRANREPKRLASIINKIAVNNKQIQVECKKCKKVIFISPSRKHKTKFCSKKCYTNAATIPGKKQYKRIYVDGIRVHEHRHIMEKQLGRKLLSTEHVHHINHDHLDNRLDNLELLSISDHAKRHTRSF